MDFTTSKMTECYTFGVESGMRTAYYESTQGSASLMDDLTTNIKHPEYEAYNQTSSEIVVLVPLYDMPTDNLLRYYTPDKVSNDQRMASSIDYRLSLVNYSLSALKDESNYNQQTSSLATDNLSLYDEELSATTDSSLLYNPTQSDKTGGSTTLHLNYFDSTNIGFVYLKENLFSSLTKDLLTHIWTKASLNKSEIPAFLKSGRITTSYTQLSIDLFEEISNSKKHITPFAKQDFNYSILQYPPYDLNKSATHAWLLRNNPTLVSRVESTPTAALGAMLYQSIIGSATGNRGPPQNQTSKRSMLMTSAA